MRIYGYFDERYDPPAPFIRTTLTSRTLKLESKHMLSYLNRNIQRMLKTTFFQKKSSHKNVGNNTKYPSCSTINQQNGYETQRFPTQYLSTPS